jgi:hypothetical protein
MPSARFITKHAAIPSALIDRKESIMMKLHRLLLTVSVLFLLWSSAANAAYPCPDGARQGETIVGMEGGFPVCESAPYSNDDEPQWENRYIAIAFGKKGYGAAADMPSKRKAEKAALAQCQKMGGEDCHIAATDSNGCIGVAINSSGNGVPEYGVTKEDAGERALKKCAQDQKNMPCEIYYSACSFAAHIR